MIIRYLYKKYLSLTLAMWLIREGLVVMDWALSVLARRVALSFEKQSTPLPLPEGTTAERSLYE